MLQLTFHYNDKHTQVIECDETNPNRLYLIYKFKTYQFYYIINTGPLLMDIILVNQIPYDIIDRNLTNYFD